MPAPDPVLAPQIEPPGRLFAALRRIWPWAWRTCHRDLGLRGINDLWRHAWAEWTFDRRYGVRTGFLIDKDKLNFDDKVLQGKSHRYRGTPAYGVGVGLRQLSDRLGGLSGETLVEYGCGAGRVMLIAAREGVDRVIGLELSPDLVELARANVAAFAARTGLATDVEVFAVDATSYVPPPEARLFYFFSPFTIDMFERSVDGIRASVREHPRTIYLQMFMSQHYPTCGLDLVGHVTGIRTLSNLHDPNAFLEAASAPDLPVQAEEMTRVT